MPKPQTELFRGLTEAEAGALSALGTETRVAAGETLFRLGDEADRMFFVLRGRITLTLPMMIRGSEEDVLVEERAAGETLGWSGLIPPHRFTLNATAAVDSTLLVFPRAALLRHFAVHPDIAYTVVRNVGSVIGHRLQVFQTMWIREMQRSVEARYP
jgi:CRP-like cAMP-binding protein